MDWTGLGDEAIDLLRRYLTIDTTNPPGGEIAGARFLAEVLAREGLASEIAESAPGRASLVARLPGDGALGGVVLHHHIDVVYADRRYWSVDPFAGEVRDGFLYGRGALDMKGIGVLQLAAVLALKRSGTPLTRDVIFLATADEEAGSAFGAAWVAAERRHWLAGAEYALSEFGGIITDARWRTAVGAIHVSEKTALALRLTARGEPGHGSRLSTRSPRLHDRPEQQGADHVAGNAERDGRSRTEPELDPDERVHPVDELPELPELALVGVEQAAERAHGQDAIGPSAAAAPSVWR